MKIKYHNLYIHIVMTVFRRERLIPEKHRTRIEKYITGICTNLNSHLYAIYANPEHTHLLISIAPNLSLEELVSTIASGSSQFINDNQFSPKDFEWQNKCSAFSVSKSDVPRVCRYIFNQPVHHKRKTYHKEHVQLKQHYQSTIRIKIR